METPVVSIRTCVRIPLENGAEPDFYSFTGFERSAEHACIWFGGKTDTSADAPLVRLHSECLTGDLFGSLRCDCGNQLKEAMELLSREGGILLYLRQEGRGIGLYHKLDAYKLQDEGYDTFEANRRLNFPEDARSFECAAHMLKALGIQRVRLLSNNPDKRKSLERFGIDVAELVNTSVYANKYNLSYLKAKVEQHHHAMTFDGLAPLRQANG